MFKTATKLVDFYNFVTAPFREKRSDNNKKNIEYIHLNFVNTMENYCDEQINPDLTNSEREFVRNYMTRVRDSFNLLITPRQGTRVEDSLNIYRAELCINLCVNNTVLRMLEIIL